MSLLVAEREDALMRVQEEAVNLRVQLAQGVTVVIKTTVEDLVATLAEGLLLCPKHAVLEAK